MAPSSAGPPGGPDFPDIMTVFACELSMLSAVLAKALSAIFFGAQSVVPCQTV